MLREDLTLRSLCSAAEVSLLAQGTHPVWGVTAWNITSLVTLQCWQAPPLSSVGIPVTRPAVPLGPGRWGGRWKVRWAPLCPLWPPRKGLVSKTRASWDIERPPDTCQRGAVAGLSPQGDFSAKGQTVTFLAFQAIGSVLHLLSSAKAAVDDARTAGGASENISLWSR